jgi:hypothetical protein
MEDSMNPNYEVPNLGSSFSTVEKIIETGGQPA